MPHQFFADAVLALHFGVVLFVVGGLVLIPLGNRLHWQWVNFRGWRSAHLLMLLVIALQAWLGRLCPLTVLEAWLRREAGGFAHEQSFIAYWLQKLLFYQAPMWVFALAYTLLVLLVVFLWWRYPPLSRRERLRI